MCNLYVRTCVAHFMHLDVREQLCVVSFLLPSYQGFQESNQVDFTHFTHWVTALTQEVISFLICFLIFTSTFLILCVCPSVCGCT